MSENQIDIVVRLQEALKARRDAEGVATGVKSIGREVSAATSKAALLGPALDKSTSAASRGLGALARSTRYPALALGGLGVAGVKWGLSFNAQVESARTRFRLFTDDVDGLTKSVQGIDRKSQFNFGDLADSAAMLGNSGIKDVPTVLQGAANAAAASGKGAQGLQSIVIALSQIQSKGRLSQEEINQLTEAGAPGVQKTIAKGFGLTADQVQNIGNEGLSSRKAIRLLTEDFTSGRMARAAVAQTKTIGGQWQLMTGNAQKFSGALTKGLTGGLEHDVLPAANKALLAVTAIVSDPKLTDGQKFRQMRQVISRELGPVADDIRDDIERMDIPQHLSDAIDDAVPFMVKNAVNAGPKVAKAFVDAWLDAGPWAKLLSLVAIGKKTGAFSTLGRLGAGGLSKGILGKADPVPVLVVNPGFRAPAGPKPPGPSIPKILPPLIPAVVTAAGVVESGLAGVDGFKKVSQQQNSEPLRQFLAAYPGGRGAGISASQASELARMADELDALGRRGDTAGYRRTIGQIDLAGQRDLDGPNGLAYQRVFSPITTALYNKSGGLDGLVSGIRKAVAGAPLNVTVNSTTKLDGRVLAENVTVQRARRNARAAGFQP